MNMFDQNKLRELISAFQKSIRWCEVNASRYFARELINMGVPNAVFGQLRIIAAEDIGLADPQLIMFSSSSITQLIDPRIVSLIRLHPAIGHDFVWIHEADNICQIIANRSTNFDVRDALVSGPLVSQSWQGSTSDLCHLMLVDILLYLFHRRILQRLTFNRGYLWLMVFVNEG